MDLPPNEGSDGFGESPYFLDWQDNHNSTIEVTWDEVEGKFAITYHDLSERENGNASIADAISTLPMNVGQTAEATDEAVPGAMAGAMVGVLTAIDIRNGQNGQGDAAMVFPEAQLSALTHDTELQGASESQRLSTRAHEMLMWYHALPASKIAEVNYGFSAAEAAEAAAAAAAIAATAAPAGDVSMLQGNGDGEENEIPNQNEEASASLFIDLSGPGEEEENCLEYQQDKLDLDLEIQVDTEDPEAIPRLTELVLTPEMSEAAAAAEAQRRRSWTGLFSFQDLQAMHQQLSALYPELEPCLPPFPDDMWLATFTANPGRFPSYVDSLCSQLQVYLDFALMVCGHEFLFHVLFGEEAEAESRIPQMSPHFSRSLLHLPLGNVQQDPAFTYLTTPYQDSCCDVDQNSEQDPDSRGNGGGPGAGDPSGGCGGAGF